ncbi:hypothetical protein D3C84_908330 [compost metagenome]
MGMGGRAVLRQVLRCRAQHVVDGQQLPPHQPRGRAIGNANGQVDMIVDQVNLAILQQQFYIDLGVTAKKFRHVGMNHESSHRLRHADPHQPFGLLGELTTDFHHRTGGADHLLTPLEHFFTAIAQAQFARGALKQPGGQGLLQTRDTAAYR